MRKMTTLTAIVAVIGLVCLTSGPAISATITVDTTDDELNADGDCSLREAIQAANTNTAVDACTAGSGYDTIEVPAGMYTLMILGIGENSNATGDLDITENLDIIGAGAATTIIRGAPPGRHPPGVGGASRPDRRRCGA